MGWATNWRIKYMHQLMNFSPRSLDGHELATLCGIFIRAAAGLRLLDPRLGLMLVSKLGVVLPLDEQGRHH